MSSVRSSRSSSPGSSPSRLSRNFRQWQRRPRSLVEPQYLLDAEDAPENTQEQRRLSDMLQLRLQRMRARRVQMRSNARNNVSTVVAADEGRVVGQDGSSAAPSWDLEENNEQRRTRQDAVQLQWENEQEMASQRYMQDQPRHRTPQDLLSDRALLRSRARIELIARLGAPREALTLPYITCAARMRGFNFANLHGQPPTISCSLSNIVARRYVQRQGATATGIPILDFEVDAGLHPPPRKDSDRALSV